MKKTFEIFTGDLIDSESRWLEAIENLAERSGLTIHLDAVVKPVFGGETKNGGVFCITWPKYADQPMDGTFFITISQDDKELIKALSGVLGYRPFCRYIHEHHFKNLETKGFITYEWNRDASNGEFLIILSEGQHEVELLK